MIELDVGDVWMTIHPDEGGRIGNLEVAGTALLHADPADGPLTWGCYPMAPWAGRVRDGRFTFDGATYQLAQNAPPHAIHGTGFVSGWEVIDAGRDFCDLQVPLAWPFGGTATQHVQLGHAGLTCMLTVRAAGEAMPAVVGWHPCFRTPARTQLEFGRMYVRDDAHIAIDQLVPPGPHPWDDCFVEPQAPIQLGYGDLTVTIVSDCDHWVVFDGLEHILCVEPQSGPPDAFNIGGATRLEAGEMLQRHMALVWSAEP